MHTLSITWRHLEMPPRVSALGIHLSDQVLAGIRRNSMGSILEAGCRPSREGTTPSSPIHQERLQDKRDRMRGTHALGANPTTTAGTSEAATADNPLQDCEGPHPSHAPRKLPDTSRQKSKKNTSDHLSGLPL